MGKAQKMVQWDPTDVKEKLLEKYPPKVARKRAKQIMINEAQENTTPEIVANVRTIPGIITMRGCTYAGCKGVIRGPTSDMVNLVHGNTSNFGTSAEPSFASCFAKRYILMDHVSKLTDGSLAV